MRRCLRGLRDCRGADGDPGENRRIAYKTYNAYARFIHSLYEFMLGAVARDRNDTSPLPAEMADKYIASHTQRILTNRREAILKGTAPDFARHFRRVRNKASAHVTYERASLNLTDFYDQYHKFLGLLYQDAKSWWGRTGKEFPDLSEITAVAPAFPTATISCTLLNAK